MNTTDKNFCSECTCYLPELCATGFHPYVGDGICNDDLNNLDCNYDAGDCCLSNVNTYHCSECSCAVGGVITSPGFPQTYGRYRQGLTWLIELPLGQYIEIVFLSFHLGESWLGENW